MPENNLERLRKYIIKELICGIGYNSSNHKLVFSRRASLSLERLNRLLDAGKSLGLDKWKVEKLCQHISFSTEEVTDAKYQINSSENKVGTVYYFECMEGHSGNLACLEIMKMSESRMLVLLSDDKGLLPGDILNLHNSRFITEGTIEASIENALECKGKWFRSLPIKAIRIKSPSLVHEVADMMNILDLSDLDVSKDTKKKINISNPVMGIIMGPHIRGLKNYLTIVSTDPTRARGNDGTSYESKNGIEWHSEAK